MEKITMKEKVLRFVESKGTATFTEIQKFIFDTKYGEGTYNNGRRLRETYIYNKKTDQHDKKTRMENTNRGYYSGAFSKGYFYESTKTYNHGGYFLRGNNRLEKTEGGTYITIRG